MNKKTFRSPIGLLGIACLLLLSVTLISYLPPVRMDLTEDKLYTLSGGTLHLLKNLNDKSIKKIHLRLYYSDKVTEGIPNLRAYAKRVQETLEEYVRQGDGNITLDVIDPEPFSEEEDAATELGLQSIPGSNNDTIFFGLVGGVADKQELISFFNPEKESTLEYDISQLIYRLHREKPLVVGVISELPVFQHRDARSGQVSQPKIILEQLRQVFDVRRVYDNNIEDIDKEIDLLMVIHPKLWPQSTLYAIDQFVLRGGRLLVFMDPKAELDKSESALFGSGGFEDQSSSLEQLLTAWGVGYDSKKVLLDYSFAHSIPVTQYGQALPHVGVLGIRDEGFNREESMTAQVDQVNVASTGVLFPLEKGPEKERISFIPLMKSSTENQLITVQEYNDLGNHKMLLENFIADKQGAKTLAAFITGTVKTAFPDGKPKLKKELKEEGDSSKENKPEDKKHLNQSEKPIAVVLFADTDILDDRMWVQTRDFYGQMVIEPWASNSDLVLNILEKLGGSVELINVRSRGTYNRPFDKVNELERQASEQFRQEEERLQAKLAETEERLLALEVSSGEGDTEGGGIREFSTEQKLEMEAFQQERLEIRKKLREVQHQLSRDIEQLGTQLKLINILTIPFLLLIVFLIRRVFLNHR